MKIMEKLRKGQVTIFGKTISVLVAVLTLVALSGVGLALLTAYVTLTGTATVSQSVVLDTTDPKGGCELSVYPNTTDLCTGETETTASYTITAYGGDTRDLGLRLKNRASTTAPLKVSVAGTLPGSALWDSDVKVELWSDYNPSLQTCAGTKVGEFSTSGSELIPASLAAGDGQWLCVKHIWNIAGIPGPYGFTVVVKPG